MKKTLVLVMISVITFYVSCGNRRSTVDQNVTILTILEEKSPDIAILNNLPLIKQVTARDGLNKREYPSTSSRIIGTLLYGARIIAHERSAERETIGGITDFWYRCQGGTQDGGYYWVFGGFLSIASLFGGQQYDLPWEDFYITDNYTSNSFRFNLLHTMFEMFPEIEFKGEREFRNGHLFRLADYQYDGIIFTISGFEPSHMDAVVRIIEISSSRFSTNRGIVVGNTQNDVFAKYGVPNSIRNNSYFYWNLENEVLELRFDFNEEGVITLIRLAVST